MLIRKLFFLLFVFTVISAANADQCPPRGDFFGSGFLFPQNNLLIADRVGYQVAALKDIDGDGVPDFATRRHNHVLRGSFVPEVTVISGGTGEEISRFLAESVFDLYGYQLGAVGDISDDGRDDLYIAHHTKLVLPSQKFPGRVYIVSPATGQILRTLTAPGEVQNDRFGESVAVIGDLNGDGLPELVIGAPDREIENCSGICYDQGAVYLFDGRTGNLLFSSLWYPDPNEPRRYGSFVGAVGDVDGDGYFDFATSDISRPEVTIFSGALAASGLPAIMTVLSSASAYSFGKQIVGLGDSNGNGRSEFALSREYSAGSDPGQVLIVELNQLGDPVLLVQIEGDEQGQIGNTLVTIPDISGDGKAELAISQINPLSSAENTGTVFIVDGRTYQVLLELNGGERGRRFGYAASARWLENGGVSLIIGDPFDTEGTDFAGVDSDTESNDYEAGLVSFFLLSGDQNQNGAMDVCEFAAPAAPLPGSPSGGGGADSSELFSQSIDRALRLIQDARKQGRRHRATRRSALRELRPLIREISRQLSSRRDARRLRRNLRQATSKKAARSKRSGGWNKLSRALFRLS